MTLRSIYIVRHGYRSDWLPYPVASPTGHQCDPSLAPHGVEQAEELSYYFQGATPKPQLIFSSPFYRCVETGYPTSRSLKIPIFLEKGIGEWFKSFRAIPKGPDYNTLKPFFDTLSDEWDSNTVIPSPLGETEDDIYQRCQKFWDVFIPKLESHFPEVQSILLVSHSATKIALGMALLGYKNVHQILKSEHGGDLNDRIDGSTCSLDSYKLEDDCWTVDFTGNTSFLSAGAEMGWHFATSRYVAGSKEELEERKRREKKELKEEES